MFARARILEAALIATAIVFCWDRLPADWPFMHASWSILGDAFYGQGRFIASPFALLAAAFGEHPSPAVLLLLSAMCFLLLCVFLCAQLQRFRKSIKSPDWLLAVTAALLASLIWFVVAAFVIPLFLSGHHVLEIQGQASEPMFLWGWP